MLYGGCLILKVTITSQRLINHRFKGKIIANLALLKGRNMAE